MTIVELKRQIARRTTYGEKLRDIFGYVIFFHWYDRRNWWFMIGTFLFLTVVSATAYGHYTSQGDTNGLHYTSDPRPMDWRDALYFSIATETTVGYGDLAPRGISRLVACLQALAGLTIAGMVLDNITSGPGSRLKTAVDRCSGDWIELTHIPENDRLIISLVTIAYVDGSLRYDGENINQYGERRGHFKGHLKEDCSLVDDRLTFDYSNRYGKVREDFDKGETELTFSGLQGGGYQTFTGHATEEETGVVKHFHGGYRAPSKVRKWMRSVEPSDLQKIAWMYSELFCKDTGRPLWPKTKP